MKNKCHVCNQRCDLFVTMSRASFTTEQDRRDFIAKWHAEVAPVETPEAERLRLKAERKAVMEELPEQIEVCPICLKWNCKMFLRLYSAKYGPEEKSERFRKYHKPVCGTCKRKSCRADFLRGQNQNVRYGRYAKEIASCKTPKMTMHRGKTKKVLPPWWVAAVAPFFVAADPSVPVPVEAESATA